LVEGDVECEWSMCRCRILLVEGPKKPCLPVLIIPGLWVFCCEVKYASCNTGGTLPGHFSPVLHPSAVLRTHAAVMVQHQGELGPWWAWRCWACEVVEGSLAMAIGDPIIRTPLRSLRPSDVPWAVRSILSVRLTAEVHPVLCDSTPLNGRRR
jgi:hypothetical protein